MAKSEDNFRKLQKKRETAFEKAIYIIKPFVVYLLVKTVAILVVSILLPTLPVPGITDYLETHSQILNAVINAVASIVAVLFVVKDFLTETDTSGEVEIDQPIVKQVFFCMKKGILAQKGKGFSLAIVISLGVTSSIFFNGILSFLSVSSEKYDQVEKIQYSVPIWLGLILYGLVSPVVEEIVFRGITYHRMRRFFTVPSSVLVSALLFGGFHANLPQFVYGTVMGILLALCYEWCQSFCAPLLFHMTANIFVFVISHMETAMTAISSVKSVVLFFILSVLLLAGCRSVSKQQHNSDLH